MNLSIQRADLARVLTAVTKVTESRNTIPILGNVLLSATDDRLTVTATDLDIEASATAPCSGEQGETTVDAKRLADIVRRMSGDTVSLAMKDDNLIVKSGRSRFTLPTLPVADFPRLDSGAPDVEFSLDFASLVAPVKFAISSEAARYYLCGVYLHAIEGKLRAVATDGHRLAHNSADLPAACPPVIIPAKTIGVVPAGVVDVSLSSRMCRFATADTVIVSKLIDGTYPDYQRVIPAANDNVVTVDRKDLASAVARAAAVASERGRAAKFTVAGDNIAIDMVAQDGTAHEDVPAEYSGEPIEIGFNSSYMQDVLASVPGDGVRISLADGQTPAIFQGDGSVLALCMPMRV